MHQEREQELREALADLVVAADAYTGNFLSKQDFHYRLEAARRVAKKRGPRGPYRKREKVLE